MKLPLSYYGNPILRKKCEPIQAITDEIKQLVADMIETMDASNGIGLAAPQIGQSIRLFVLRRYSHKEDDKWVVTEPFVYINPKITFHAKELCVEEEGCLSIPGLRASVERPVAIRVEATDLAGNAVVHDLEGFNARVVMHENDHINGTLFIDRLEKATRAALEPELLEIKKRFT